MGFRPFSRKDTIKFAISSRGAEAVQYNLTWWLEIPILLHLNDA